MPTPAEIQAELDETDAEIDRMSKELALSIAEREARERPKQIEKPLPPADPKAVVQWFEQAVANHDVKPKG
jgi:hypothetical protein